MWTTKHNNNNKKQIIIVNVLFMASAKAEVKNRLLVVNFCYKNWHHIAQKKSHVNLSFL